MKFLIWGTGKCAARLLEEQQDSSFFKENEILAFIDNDSSKWGNYFGGLPIISPSEIPNYPFDYISILTYSYENEIRAQLIATHHIANDKILNNSQTDDIIYQYYENKYQLSAKRILAIGDREIFAMDGYRGNEHCFNFVGFIDATNLEQLANYNFDYIFLFDDIAGINALRQKYPHNTLEHLRNELCTTYHIDPFMILPKGMVLIYHRQKIDLRSNGCNHPDKIFLQIIIHNGAGLGTIVNYILRGIAYALTEGYIPVVDMMSHKNQYLEMDELNKINAWENYFFQPFRYTMEDIKQAQHVIPWHSYNRNHRILCNRNLYQKYIKLKPHIQAQIDNYLQETGLSGKRTLGVLFRGTDYSNGKPYNHNIQPSLDEMINTVKEKLHSWDEFDSIYLCTEDQDAVDEFKKEFKQKLFCYPQQRFPKEISIKRLAMHSFNRQQDAYYRGEEYLAAIYVLAQCNSLVAGSCGATAWALLINQEQYENKYIFELGKYGIDDNPS